MKRGIESMVEPTPEDLVRALEDLTDRQRLEFALWAADQPNLTPTRLEWGTLYLEGNAAMDDAVRAFDNLRRDQSVPDREGEWFFDPSFPEGWVAWHAAEAHVRAMALAVQQHDATALSALAEAFARVGLPRRR
jgi:squalene cyclase